MKNLTVLKPLRMISEASAFSTNSSTNVAWFGPCCPAFCFAKLDCVLGNMVCLFEWSPWLAFSFRHLGRRALQRRYKSAVVS